ncbi:uncharacterized protein LOC112083554 [Eutrema salsugineum]|uniref:uncharacterized protein LOC112083554 n=1 Tax=Eutrema salsugineum TaxID=72664 RepID=UPI000CED4E4C|nr:uncharacterized protein LOC112083554 [Eutrema salsugineum]
MWIANLNRIPTKARIASWGVNISLDCCLCARDVENRDHLLLTCRFSAEIWKMVLARLDRNQPMFFSWAELLSWMSTRSPQAPSTLRKLTTHATIYHIWRQRNNVLHNQQTISPMAIFKIIDRMVKNIITARRHRRAFSDLMVLWIR